MSVQDYIMGLRHVGVIVEDLRAALDKYRAVFDLRDEDVRVVPPFGVGCDTRFAFLNIGGTEFELIEPVSERFRALLLARGDGLNHVAFRVRDLEKVVALMQAKGIRLGHVTPEGIARLPRWKMAYFNPEDTAGLLVEMIETED